VSAITTLQHSANITLPHIIFWIPERKVCFGGAAASLAATGGGGGGGGAGVLPRGPRTGPEAAYYRGKHVPIYKSGFRQGAAFKKVNKYQPVRIPSNNLRKYILAKKKTNKKNKKKQKQI
jgi:hypothetical protein